MQETIAAADALNYLEYRYLQVQIGRLEGTLFWGGIVLVKWYKLSPDKILDGEDLFGPSADDFFKAEMDVDWRWEMNNEIDQRHTVGKGRKMALTYMVKFFVGIGSRR